MLILFYLWIRSDKLFIPGFIFEKVSKIFESFSILKQVAEGLIHQANVSSCSFCNYS